MVLCFVNGEEISADQVKTGELVVEDNEYRPKLGASIAATTIKVDSSKTPQTIDFTYTAGPQKGQTVKGIYKIDRDDLTVCRGLTSRWNVPPSLRPRLTQVCCSWSGNEQRTQSTIRSKPSS